MSGSSFQVTPWPAEHPPTELEIRNLLNAEALEPYAWSNAPGDVYAPHSHPYHKIIYIVNGSITFGLPDEDRRITLQAGDRLQLPAGMVHDAVVGPVGVLALEAHRPA